MEPTNASYKSNGCSPMSSECVIYNNQNLDCFNICIGDSVGDVIFGLGTLLCNLIAKEYTICNTDGVNYTAELDDILTNLGTRICELEAAAGPEPVTPFTCENVKTCEFDGNAVVPAGGTLESIIEDIATATSNVQTEVTDDVLPTLANHEGRIEALEDAPEPTFEIPDIIPTCVLPAVPTPITEVLSELEEAFCNMKAIIGTNPEMIQAIARQCLNLNTDNALANNIPMSAIPGWNSAPATMSATVNNLWLTICDIRSAIKDLKLNCCNGDCDGFVWTMSILTDASGQITFYFNSVVIPAGFLECDPAGTTFTIKDASLNSFTFKIPIAAYAGTPDTYVINIVDTPLNPSSNYVVTMHSCFNNSSTGITCEKVESTLVSNPTNCPETLYTPSYDSIAYSFTGVAGLSYSIETYTSGGYALISSIVHANVIGGLIEGTITGLEAETDYQIVMTVSNTAIGTSTICATAFATTLTAPSPAE